MIRIVLAGEPIGKGRPRFVRATGRTYTPEQTASFENKLALQASLAMRGRALLTGAVAIDVVAFRSVPASWSAKKRAAALNGALQPIGKPDWDNLAKCVGDALNKVVWLDDSQIVRGRLEKKYSDQPRLEIVVTSLDSNEQVGKTAGLFD